MSALAGILTFSGFFSAQIERQLPMATDTEADERILILQARRGSRDAIAALVARYSHGLFRYLLSLSGDPALAEDLLQDTWLRVMERLDSYRPGYPFGNWLFTVARNRAFDVLRQRSRRLPHWRADTAEGLANPAEEVPDPNPSVLEKLAEADLAQSVMKAMKSLPAAFREVLTLRFEQELDIGAIARILRLPASAVKDRLYRGLDQLRLRTERLAKHG
jgi:RNA polymerase sigma-70 factor (ECF subfamily)